MKEKEKKKWMQDKKEESEPVSHSTDRYTIGQCQTFWTLLKVKAKGERVYCKCIMHSKSIQAITAPDVLRIFFFLNRRTSAVALEERKTIIIRLNLV